MKSLRAAARWVLLAREPKAIHSAVRTALFPLPFWPVMKLTCWPSSMWRLEWHIKFSSRMREIVPAIAGDPPSFLSSPAEGKCGGFDSENMGDLVGFGGNGARQNRGLAVLRVFLLISI